MNREPVSVKDYIFLQALILIFSAYSVCAKFAGNQPLWSPPFFGLYALSMLPLGAYALAWQRLIKRMPLTFAYANRAVAVVWGMLWGKLIFGEAINAAMLAGAAVILAGVALYASSGGGAKHGSA